MKSLDPPEIFFSLFMDTTTIFQRFSGGQELYRNPYLLKDGKDWWLDLIGQAPTPP